jgi:hypothetical protein
MARPKKQPIPTWMNVTEFILGETDLQTLQFIRYTLHTRIEALESGATSEAKSQ